MGSQVNPLHWFVFGLFTMIFLLLVYLLMHSREKFFRWLKTRKREIAVTLTWSIAVALVIIKSYWLLYVTHPVLVEHGIAWTRVNEWVPRLGTLDYLLIFLMSVIAGAILVDLKNIIYSFIATVVFSFVFAVTYSSLFIWYILKWGETLSLLGGWLAWIGDVIYVAMLSIFRMVFPLVILLCILGVFLGAFGRGILQPSAQV